MPSETKNLPNDMNETVYRKKQGMEGRKEGRKKEHTDLGRKKLYHQSYLRNLLIQPYVSFLSA